jgi:hypothetical protein
MIVLDAAAAAAVRGKSERSMGLLPIVAAAVVFLLSCKMLAVFIMNLHKDLARLQFPRDRRDHGQ